MRRKDFDRGFFCAVAALLNSHGDSTVASDLFKLGGKDLSGVDEEDIDTFIKHGYCDENKNIIDKRDRN